MTSPEDFEHYPYVDASHITLAEETEEEVRSDPVEYYTICHQWRASIRGKSYRLEGIFRVGGPEVDMERYGKTAEEAYQKLIQAITEQGWTIA